MNNIFITKEKKKELEKELEFLSSEGRAEASLALESAKSLGDLSENAEYHQALDKKSELESRILEIKNILKNHQIIEPTKSNVVTIGSNVIIQKDGEKKKQEFFIVGDQESDISKGKISINSPLANSMEGKKKGDSFQFETPSETIFSYKVLDIK